MITEKLYKDCVKAIEDFHTFEEKIHSATRGAISLFEMDEIQQMMLCLERLLEYCTKDTVDGKYDPTTLEYFIYESDFGNNAEEYFITDGGKDYHFYTVDDLWDYLVEMHPEIEDKLAPVEKIEKADLFMENDTSDHGDRFAELLAQILTKELIRNKKEEN